MSTHTKELIGLRPSGLLATTNGNVRFIAHMERHAPVAPSVDEMDDQDQADGERLAECWNAMLTIENPQEALRMARELLQKIKKASDIALGGNGDARIHAVCLAQDFSAKALAALGAQPEE